MAQCAIYDTPMAKMLGLALLTLVLASPGLAAQTPAAVKATAQNAAAFVGDWELSGEGPAGPAYFELSLKPDGQGVRAIVTREAEPQTVTDVSMASTSLVVSVTFVNAGSEYPSVV